METLTIPTIDETNFVTEFTKWFQHKIILYERAKYCFTSPRKNGQVEAYSIFKNYITKNTIGNKYDLANKILQFEKVLVQILPTELNTSYESSKILLNAFINYSKNLVKDFAKKTV